MQGLYVNPALRLTELPELTRKTSAYEPRNKRGSKKNYGIFLSMGNAGSITSAVVSGFEGLGF